MKLTRRGGGASGAKTTLLRGEVHRVKEVECEAAPRHPKLGSEPGETSGGKGRKELLKFALPATNLYFYISCNECWIFKKCKTSCVSVYINVCV